MLNHILSNTPLYVWAILAFLFLRGVSAMRDREMAMGKLFIIPLVMLALALQDILAKFGMGGLALTVWVTAALGATLLVLKFGSARLSLGTAPGNVRVRGSWLPLVMMLAIFVSKYTVSVALAIAPQLRHEAPAVAAVCVLLGVLNGYFIGRLAADVAAYRSLQTTVRTGDQAAVAV